MELKTLYLVFYREVSIKKKILSQKYSNSLLSIVFSYKSQLFRSQIFRFQHLTQTIAALPSFYLYYLRILLVALFLRHISN